MIQDQRARLLFRVSDLIKDVQCILLRDDITPADKQTLRKILEIVNTNKLSSQRLISFSLGSREYGI